MFDYEVYTEQQALAERFQLLKEGVYEGLISSSKDTTSSKGSPMMDMTVTVYDESGRPYEIRDFLVFTKKMMWKIVHFAQSAGIEKEYMEGKLCSELVINKRVKVKLSIEPGTTIPQERLHGKPVGSRYPDKNKIEDYVVHDGQNLVDDDVPF